VPGLGHTGIVRPSVGYPQLSRWRGGGLVVLVVSSLFFFCSHVNSEPRSMKAFAKLQI
jgi:hypothetical protein